MVMKLKLNMDYYETDQYRLIRGDCLEEMAKLEPGSIDLVLTDPPYGTTACKWDSVIPFAPMWEQIERLTKVCVLFCCEPFSSMLVASNVNFFKYSLVWKKSRVQHFAQAPYRFLTEHEDIKIFSKQGTSKNAKNSMTYNPQGTVSCNKVCKGKGHSDHRPSQKTQEDYVQTVTNYPRSILSFKSSTASYHPTQKPVALLEYLIKTYTQTGQIVLDFTMGSGSTGVAAMNLGRKFVGIEMDGGYFWKAKDRIDKAYGSGLKLFYDAV